MLFNSFIFIEFLLVTFFIYYLPVLKKYQLQILILASLVFYSYYLPILLLLLLFSASINILVSYLVVNGNPSLRKVYATAGVLFNLAVLIFFKYSTLLAKSFFDTGQGLGHFLILIPLPIGISFYTFEGISLLMDVYSNKHHDVLTIDKSFKTHTYKTLFFISFFPHLIAGPILKAYEFYPQIGNKKFSDISWERAAKSLIMGYFLKMVIADNLTNYTFWMANPYFKTFSSLDLISMVFAYSFQIFADFAGYSLIAIGLARLFGYELMENFNFPYISVTFSEFWRRWHISLSTFLREYLYIPMGGNRKGKIRTYVNLIVTMVLGGLWHGAAWSYAVWGALHGLFLAIERVFTNNVFVNRTSTSSARKILSGALVFLLVTLAWLLFKLPFQDVEQYILSIGLNRHLPTAPTNILFIAIYSLPVILYHLVYLLSKKFNFDSWRKKYEFIVYGFLLFMIVVNSGPSGSFIYFQF